MFSLQEYQHVHLLWFKKRSFTLVWKPNPPLCSVRCAHLRARADVASESTMGVRCSRSAYAPLLRCLRSATRAVWNGRKTGSTEALALKAPLFTWSVKSFSCYNVPRLFCTDALEQRRPCTRTSATTSNFYLHTQKMVANFGRSLEPCPAI